MPKKGKKYQDAIKRFDREQLHQPIEAVGLVKSLANASFDESIDLSFRLGVDPRKADQILRGTVGLPAGTGKTVRVAVFAAGEAANEARQAGADIVGSDDLVDKVQNENFLDFDIAIAHPDLMGQVGRLGRILGPRGLMPNPRTGTVTPDIARAVGEFKAGRVEYRTDKFGNIHIPIGRASFVEKDLLKNMRVVVDELNRVKPASAKGKYIRSVNISSTMGPGIKIDSSHLRITDEDLGVSV